MNFQSQRVFLARLLNFAARDGNIAVLPEAARFARGDKRVLRVVTRPAALDEYQRTFAALGVSVECQPWGATTAQGTWSDISGARLDEPPHLIGVYLSRDKMLAREAARLDMEQPPLSTSSS